MTKRLDKLVIELTSDGTKFKRGLASAQRDAERHTRSVQQLFKRAGVTIAATLGASLSVGLVRQYSDAYTSVQNRLTQVTNSTHGLSIASGDVVRIARETRTDLEAVATLYSRTARRADVLGISQKQVAEFTLGVNRALKAYGATSQEASSATIQLSQALGKGVLNGDEFRTISEAAPPLLAAIAREAGVAESELKKMGEQGTLTADLVVKGVLNASKVFEDDYAKTIRTTSDALEIAATNSKVWVGENESLRASITAVNESIVLASENIDNIINGAELLAVVFGARLVGAMGIFRTAGTATSFATLRMAGTTNIATVGMLAYKAQLLQTTRASLVANSAMTGLRTAMSFLGGPVGVAILAAYGLFLLANRADLAKERTKALKKEIGELRGEIDGLNIAMLAKKQTDFILEQIDAEQGLLEVRAKLAEFDKKNVGPDAETNRGKLLLRKKERENLKKEEEERITRLDVINAKIKAVGDTIKAMPTILDRSRIDFDRTGVAIGAASEFLALQKSLLSEREKINDSYVTSIGLVEANTLANSKARNTLIAKVKVTRDEALALLEKKAAQEAAEKAEKSGVPALRLLIDRNKELAAVTDFSSESIRRQEERTRIITDVQNHYKDATRETIEALITQRTLESDLLRTIELKSEVLERYAPTQDSYAERLQAIEELHKTGVLSMLDYKAAIADLKIEAGEGTQLDGFISQLERMEEAGKMSAANLGSSFAEVFGPGGTLEAGLATSAANALIFGQDFKSSFADIARSAVAGLTAELIQMGIQMLLSKLIFDRIKSQQNSKFSAALVSKVTAEALSGSLVAGINAYASTAAIPIIGPALAPAAAAQAIATTGALAAAASAAASLSLAGQAHAGLSNVPKEGTYILNKGERVIKPEQNRDLTNFLDRPGGGGVNISVVVNQSAGSPPLSVTEQTVDTNGNIRLVLEESVPGIVRRTLSEDLASGRGLSTQIGQTFGLKRTRS